MALEAPIGFGSLLGQQLSGSGSALGEMAAQGTWGEACFGDGVGVVEGEDVGHGAGRAVGLLSFESFGPVEGVGRDGAGLALVTPGFGLEALEALLSIATFPAAQGGGADGVAGGVRDVVVAGGDLLP